VILELIEETAMARKAAKKSPSKRKDSAAKKKSSPKKASKRATKATARKTSAKKSAAKKRSSKSKSPVRRGPSKPKARGVSHPGMMGDGTEEQNLNEAGNPKARISEGEVDAAFNRSKQG